MIVESSKRYIYWNKISNTTECHLIATAKILAKKWVENNKSHHHKVGWVYQSTSSEKGWNEEGMKRNESVSCISVFPATVHGSWYPTPPIALSNSHLSDNYWFVAKLMSNRKALPIPKKTKTKWHYQKRWGIKLAHSGKYCFFISARMIACVFGIYKKPEHVGNEMNEC